jgi:hypothetical protein
MALSVKNMAAPNCMTFPLLRASVWRAPDWACSVSTGRPGGGKLHGGKLSGAEVAKCPRQARIGDREVNANVGPQDRGPAAPWAKHRGTGVDIVRRGAALIIAFDRVEKIEQGRAAEIHVRLSRDLRKTLVLRDNFWKTIAAAPACFPSTAAWATASTASNGTATCLDGTTSSWANSAQRQR